MKNRLLVSLTVPLFLFAALAYAGDKDKDKTKTNPPPKQTAVVHPKPSPAPRHTSTATPGHQIAGRPTESMARVSDHGKPNIGAQGPQRGQQNQPVIRHVSTQELHRRMSAPVSRDRLVMARDHYHQVELTRFKMRGYPVRLEPRHRVVLGNLRILPRTYYHRRAVFYDAYGFVPPIYIYSLRPSYGLWCATFLAFMLDRIAIDQQYEYSLMYYDHMREPEFIQWRLEMNGLAAENAELREKLAALDQRVSQLEGTPRNAAYVPEEAGDVALSPQVIDKFTSGPEKQQFL